IRSRLRALDPSRYRALRSAALGALEQELDDAATTGPAAWRLTADLLFIIEHPEIREAFFPSCSSELSVDSALARDREPVLAIARRHEAPQTVRVIERWWEHGRAFFDVARDAAG